MDDLLFPAIKEIEFDGAVGRTAAFSGLTSVSSSWASPTLKDTTNTVKGKYAFCLD